MYVYIYIACIYIACILCIHTHIYAYIDVDIVD